jgi:hypothetical protein
LFGIAEHYVTVSCLRTETVAASAILVLFI